MTTALVPIAHGSEEIEATTIINVLVRGGVQVEICSVHDTKEIEGSRGIRIVANSTIAECVDKTYDLIALPGGMPGAEHFRDCAPLITLLKKQREAGRFYASICASPAIVFDTHGLLEGHKACCYPCFNLKPENTAEGNPRVVVSTKCITSVGPSSALEFALKLVELLVNKKKAEEVAAGMLTTL